MCSRKASTSCVSEIIVQPRLFVVTRVGGTEPNGSLGVARLCRKRDLLRLRAAAGLEQAAEEPREGECTECKDGVADGSQPTQHVHDRRLQELRTPRVPVADFD